MHCSFMAFDPSSSTAPCTNCDIAMETLYQAFSDRVQPYRTVAEIPLYHKDGIQANRHEQSLLGLRKL